MLRLDSPWILALSLVLAACGDDGSTAEDDGTQPTSTGAVDTDAATGTTSDGSTSADDSGSDTAGDTTTAAGVCELEQPAIVTDIDETLTLSDAEFIMQIGDGTYDPLEREGAAELVTAYADLGYHVLYLTARNEQTVIEVTGETAREATQRWLEEHGFPTDPGSTELVLAEMFVFDADAQAYKAAALMERQAAGMRYDYAYGNATSDIGAYAEAGIPLDATFIIGEHAGEGGTVAVAGEDWLEHTATHIPTVPAVCEDR